MIGASDFEAFFESVRGYAPFPWQERLARRVVETGTWPEILALPTAAGKTAVVDVAIFALACQADRPASERTAPLRTVFVVDRRIVVDETYEHALRLAERLARAIEKGEGGAVGEVARRLAEIARRGLPEDVRGRLSPPPLEVAELRGGIYRDRPWTRSPAQPVVCVSTVDQVGSRLLFRPYGLSSYAAPIHAGLLANDVLFVLDEAHLSHPFEETLRAIARYREWAESPIRSPFRVLTMTATPSSDGESFELDESDRDHPILARRLEARKEAELPDEISDDAQSGTEDDRFAAALAEKAIEIAGSDPDVHVIGIVANRVRTARAVHRILVARAAGEAILLTGRARPYDRDRLLETWGPRIRAGRARNQDQGRPIFVVATQCIEVGANIDFDALVTECASLDALRQRFGRLDRLGERRTSRAAILARRSSLSSREPDPVYGEALANTWVWLRRPAEKGRGRKAKPRIDMGSSALAARLADLPPEKPCVPPKRRAPVMLPGHLDLFARTSPVPAVDPEPALFLHGPEAGPADVAIVWRADLGRDPSRWVDIVAMLPPASAEAVPVPVGEVRRWLAEEPSVGPGVSDVEGAMEDDDSKATRTRRFIRWLGPEESEVLDDPSMVRPGDTIVVPSEYGGLDAFGWDPESQEPVPDIAEPVALRIRGRALLRLHPGLAPTGPVAAGGAEAPKSWRNRWHILFQSVMGTGEAEPSDADLRADLLAMAGAADAPDWIRKSSEILARHGWRAIAYPDDQGRVLAARIRTPTGIARSEAEREIADEDDSASMTKPVSIAEHCRGVSDWAKAFCEASGLAGDRTADVSLAAWLHDIGKADPRFQRWLAGGDEIEAMLAPEPLAKSGMDPSDRLGWTYARELAGYPRGERHEALSVCLAERHPEALRCSRDPELVLHLIASHHGRARPFVPPPEERGEPEPLRLRHGEFMFEGTTDHRLYEIGSGVAERFAILARRYGWYGLAFLEALLRLADHRRSEWEEKLG